MASANLPRNRFFGITLAELVQRLLQHRLADDQFADQIEHVVDASGFDSQDVFRGDLRVGCGCRCGSARIALGWTARWIEWSRDASLLDSATVLRGMATACGRFRRALALQPDFNAIVTSPVMVGIWHLAAICSFACALAKTNSTCLEAAGDFASGRTTITRPCPPIAF